MGHVNIFLLGCNSQFPQVHAAVVMLEFLLFYILYKQKNLSRRIQPPKPKETPSCVSNTTKPALL